MNVAGLRTSRELYKAKTPKSGSFHRLFFIDEVNFTISVIFRLILVNSY